MRARRWITAATAGLLALTMTACAASERGGSGGEGGGNFVFGAAGAPKNFDPIWNDDGESFRPARQMFDTLITYKQGTTELEPGLATAWQSSPDGKTWTFTLREGVTFHDGTPFDAAAVCFNFDRWYTMQGAAAQSQMIYYGDVFEGFAKNEGDASGDPVYKSCTAENPTTAVLQLNKFKGAFPAAFGLTSLSISSPTALQQYDADAVTQSGDSFTYPAYANEHPTGTGPFRFESYDKANGTITLARNDDYWGEKAKVDKLIFKVIPDENARKQELAAGTIDGYDYPSPADYGTLKEQGNQILIRDPFSILYVGINTKNNPALKDVRVRQAIAYAIDRESLVRTKMPEGSAVAQEFVPPTVAGYAQDVTQYPYDPEKAKQLLAEAGAQNLTLNFYYPTEVTRPYMPNPADLFSAMSANLQAVGITVNPVARPWNGGYKDDVQKAGKHDLHMLGWTGDYNDAGNFVGTFFGREKAEFGPQDPAMYDALAKADAIPDPAGHAAAYEQVNSDIVGKYLPAVPILTTGPAIVVKDNVQGVVPSPLTDERFYTVSKN
ncbi:Dipeptide-binding ABC transporter, periplasmic substrate-binding component [Pseudonocardia sp. Ae168_Ps1]|uniref:ABC transporter substrate-binding protein n=1 Tax=unclassified Pseudonocardia TaxID=2619320 RepID=UPI00095A4B80|nr:MULTISPECIES: ABC transporter substrate-binding protein [unclassified Pseudonocardia]OLL76595.1 Dipeptide-binding ABC transporter, periplasmic substrate-binding component [Pseudonocardia sp. Ae150A_Ps1]OLL82604.1 Dipeptide-binding ABC transporter, periplasmic substrate-binding component [Pseudonocardia sp. Ae168_Ps1]OLL83281.1 Dipeptide-binding ABC transporter, periplasmic substrate-binding component [Pseudonocardia sp. Ae263_Ps1]OLL90681.1 Dipeptide-binding ABC transporter, periplasmic subs